MEEVIKHVPKESAIVTFLIGNGFDIGLGLKTKYSDFINGYLKKATSKDEVVALKRSITNNVDLWGDAEIAFGKLPFSSFGNNADEALKVCYTDFCDSLAEYLSNEVKRITVPEDDIKMVFCSTLCSYYQNLSDYPLRNELKRLKRFRRLKVNIINFNYTETIDKMLPQFVTLSQPGWGEVDIQINEVCHVHGALSAGLSRSFGVNMASQIEDEHLSAEAKTFLIKPDIDRAAGWGLEATAKGMIGESDTVVLFGLSMGASDQLWWDYLLNYVRHDSEHRICMMQFVNRARGARFAGEEAVWADGERKRLYDAVDPQKIKYIDTEDLNQRIIIWTSP